MMEKCMVCGRIHFYAQMEWECGLPFCSICHERVFVPGVDRKKVIAAILGIRLKKHDPCHCQVLTPRPPQKKTRDRIHEFAYLMRSGDHIPIEQWAPVPFHPVKGEVI